MEQVLQRRSRRGFRERLERAGLSAAHERRFNFISTAFVAVYIACWIFTIARSISMGEAAPPIALSTVTANPLSGDAPPVASFLTEAALRKFASRTDYRGISGAVYLVIPGPSDTLALPDSASGAQFRFKPLGSADTTSTAGATSATAPGTAGIWKVLVQIGNATREVPGMTIATVVPLSEKRGNYIGNYLIGSWPFENGKPRSAAYAPPRGLVKVTPENMNTQITEHLTLGDYLTKGQANVWPKYVAMVPRELDKIELTLQELKREGHPVTHLGIISAFRTPNYNVEGGNPAGRAALSRHMYGDAMDIYIDNNRDGRMDDLNGDGRVDVNDARIIARAADLVERDHPTLIGGIGIYAPTGAHSGFVHIDTRGNRARWGAW
jgi:hypothetical protein